MLLFSIRASYECCGSQHNTAHPPKAFDVLSRLLIQE